MATRYPKRLIEVDLPIKRISAHARREKSIRHGHISTLHIWWARRPLAACRAVICASLWPDPADELCPEMFRKVAREQMTKWAKVHLKLLSVDSYSRFVAISKNESKLDDLVELRAALLDFIADFANWDNSTVPEYLETSRLLTQSAHEALGSEAGSRPLVVDPFAGGGAIPLEALRIGADAFASDLNPVAVLLNKVVLEYIPKYGQRLADEVRKWGQWIKEQAEKELAEFYPKDAEGAIPIAYLWARTIQCEGPGCGAEVPLMRSLWLAKKGPKSVALRIIPRPSAKCVDFEIINNAKPQDVGEGTIRRSAATCPCCSYTTPVGSVRAQMKKKHGGAKEAKLVAVVCTRPGKQGRFYRLPTKGDFIAVKKASEVLESQKKTCMEKLSLIPNEPFPPESAAGAISSSVIYGIRTWGDLFSCRQALALATLVRLTNEIPIQGGSDLVSAIKTLLAFVIDKQADLGNSLNRWEPIAQCPRQLFGRQAIPMVWDFAEGVVIGKSSGSWSVILSGIIGALEKMIYEYAVGHVELMSATRHALPDDAAACLFTDPPYYDAIAYGDLADFFYVWLKRTLKKEYPTLLQDELADKTDEVVQMSRRFAGPYAHKDKQYFEQGMKLALTEARRYICSRGIGIVVFAHKSTSGWEAQLKAMLEAGWIVTGSWAVDTECGSRMNAMGTATLASSVHIVMRPRENPDGSARSDYIGDWRDVLFELPKRIHEWMPRLAEEGVVGADAIFACLGPALEIYSRYSSVEKASGEKVELKEYLEEVWAAVSREALAMIFEGADASGFEEDARLTAMWLWTLRTALNGNNGRDDDTATTKNLPGYSLEYDAARKIAQGLGAHLEALSHLVEIKGSTAVLLSAAARTHYLFGKDAAEAPKRKQKKKSHQLTLFDVEKDIEQMKKEAGGWIGEIKGKPGSTVLDQLHQCMILFGAGRGEAMKRFLVEEGVGRNPLFWRLAQALSALYPTGTDEKRWVDGVLARKKGLGL